MRAHVFFWIGAFVSAIIALPLALISWGFAIEIIKDKVVFIGSTLFAIVIVLVLTVVFREWIFRKLSLNARATTDEAVDRLVAIFDNITVGDRRGATEESAALAQSIFSIYAWGSFYRWAIGTAAGLLLIFGTFTGTVLLFQQNEKLEAQTGKLGEQNKKLQQQNELIGKQIAETSRRGRLQDLLIIENLRRQLENSGITGNTAHSGYLRYIKRGSEDRVKYLSTHCGQMFLVDRALWRMPNPSTIEAIVQAAKLDDIGPTIIRALKSLALDRHATVAMGSLLALEKLEEWDTDRTYTIRNLFLSDYPDFRALKIRFEDSVVGPFNCLECTVDIKNSVLIANNVHPEIRTMRDSVYILRRINDYNISPLRSDNAKIQHILSGVIFSVDGVSPEIGRMAGGVFLDKLIKNASDHEALYVRQALDIERGRNDSLHDRSCEISKELSVQNSFFDLME